jgi:hypothetical protein
MFHAVSLNDYRKLNGQVNNQLYNSNYQQSILNKT